MSTPTSLVYVHGTYTEHHNAVKGAAMIAKRLGRTLYVDMCSGLPNTPWVAWCEARTSQLAMRVCDLVTHKETVVEPEKK